MNEAPKVREACDGDIPEILGVLKSALGKTPLLERTPELFAWKHKNNPFGPSIVLVAEIGGRLAGVRTLMRWSLATPSGHEVACVRAVDTATHPDFQRRGVFRTLTLSALEVARAEGVDLVFNTPNSKSAPGYILMGWHEVGWIGAMVRLRFRRTVSPDSDNPPNLESAIPSARPFASYRHADRPPLGLRTIRTADYLMWRFTQHPTARYGWVAGAGQGGAVVRASQRKGRSETVVADTLGTDPRSALRNVVKSNRSHHMAAWFSPGTPERHAARSVGMFAAPGLKTLRLVANPLVEIDIDVSDLRSWDLAVSDLELL